MYTALTVPGMLQLKAHATLIVTYEVGTEIIMPIAQMKKLRHRIWTSEVLFQSLCTTALLHYHLTSPLRCSSNLPAGGIKLFVSIDKRVSQLQDTCADSNHFLFLAINFNLKFLIPFFFYSQWKHSLLVSRHFKLFY